MAAGAASLAGCSRMVNEVARRELPTDLRLPPNPEPTARLLGRVGFGPRPGELSEVAAIGPGTWVHQQLAPDASDDPALMLQLAQFEALSEDAAELRDDPDWNVTQQLSAAAILRATYSRWPLRERMVDLWTNHFNIYADKARGAFRKPTDDLKVIRTHALGTFPEMLAASAKSPAMLTYLDNQLNDRRHPNENYARELMELHTLGVHGGYTQRDVMNVARCFTGWTVENRFLRPRGTFRFDADQHDDGEKLVLGHVITSGGGVSDGEEVLAILGAHPSTARFIASKLTRTFLGKTEGPWVDRLANIYLQTKGDIPSMLEPLLTSDDLVNGEPIPKRPFDFLVSALRVTGAATDGIGVQAYLDRMGQPLFSWPMPDGYPDRAAAWTGSMLGRWNFAHDLTHGAAPGAGVNASELLASTHADPARAAVIVVLSRPTGSDDPVLDTLRSSKGDANGLLALALSSPEFQYR